MSAPGWVARIRLLLLALVGVVPYLAVGSVVVAIEAGMMSRDFKALGWSWSLIAIAMAWVVYSLDLLLDRSASRGPWARFGWVVGFVFAWPLALPLYWLEVQEPTPWMRSDLPRHFEKEKIRAGIAHLEEHEVGHHVIGPPFYRAAWWLGFLVPPPAFTTVLQRLRIEGLSLAVLAAVVIDLQLLFGTELLLSAWLDDWWGELLMPMIVFPLMGSLMGTVATVLLGVRYTHVRKTLDLARWTEIEP